MVLRLDHRTRVSAHAHNMTLRLVNTLNRGLTLYNASGLASLTDLSGGASSTEIWQANPISAYSSPDGFGTWNSVIHNHYVYGGDEDGLLLRSADPGAGVDGGVIGEALFGAAFGVIPPGVSVNFIGNALGPAGAYAGAPWYWDGAHDRSARVGLQGASAEMPPILIASLPDGSTVHEAWVEMLCANYWRKDYTYEGTYTYDWDPNSSAYVPVISGTTGEVTTDQGAIGLSVLAAYQIGDTVQWHNIGGSPGCADYKTDTWRLFNATGCVQAMLAHRHDPYLIGFAYIAGPGASYVVAANNTQLPTQTIRPLCQQLLAGVSVEWDVTDPGALTPHSDPYLYIKKATWYEVYWDTMNPGTTPWVEWSYPASLEGVAVSEAWPAVR